MRTDGGLRNPSGAFWLAALPALLCALACPTDTQAQVRPAPPPPLDAMADAPGPSPRASPGATASPSATLNRSVESAPSLDRAAAPTASPASAQAALATPSATSAAAPSAVAVPTAPSREKAGSATEALPAPGPGEAADLAPASPGTMEIPPAVPPLVVPNPQLPPMEPAARQPAGIAAYENQNPSSYPTIGSLKDFMAESEQLSPIGIRLRETRRKLKTGEEADGLLVVAVTSGSPAEKAGLHPYRHTLHPILMGMAIVSAAIFPPAILLVPAVDYYERAAESYDMIIAVDGARVTNFFDFEERMRDAQPGEIVYLSVVRDGKRVQLRVSVPPAVSSASK